MRTIDLVLAAIMLFFAALQYNDPDGLYWFAVYALAAFWCLLPVVRPGAIGRSAALRLAVATSVAAFLAGFLWLAPTIDKNWIHVEEAREAFGYLLCALATLTAWFGDRRLLPIADRVKAA